MVTCQTHDHVAVITLDDGKANVLNGASLGALDSALGQASDARAIVLSGRPGFFSGGLNLKKLPTLPPDELRDVLHGFFALSLKILQSPVPIVAAISGHSMAGGTVLSLSCDAAIGARGPFKMGLNEVAIGVELPHYVAELAMTRLTPAYLLRALAHGEVFPLEECVRVGYLDELVEPEALAAAALTRARALGALHPRAYREAKAYLRRALAGYRPEDVVGSVQQFFLAAPTAKT